MTTAEQIVQQLGSLPEPSQKQVLDFIEYLKAKSDKSEAVTENTSWSEFSLKAAVKGMEDEDALYTPADIKESFR